MNIEQVIAYQRENFPRDNRINKDWKSLYIMDNLKTIRVEDTHLLYNKVSYLYGLELSELLKELHGSDMSI